MDLVPIKNEFIQISIEFVSEFTNVPPDIKIFLDDVFIKEIVLPNGKYSSSFFVNLETNKTHCLKIVRSNKSVGDEQMTRITDLIIDKISVRDLAWHTSLYYPEYPEPWASEQRKQGVELEYPVVGETWFGHNGTWVFKFSSPFYRYVIHQVTGTRK